MFRIGSSGTSSTPNSEVMVPKTKQPKADKKCWSESFGFRGAKIRIAEREPGGVLYLLWLDKQGKQQKRSLGHRDRKLGKKQALELANGLAQGAGANKPQAIAEVAHSGSRRSAAVGNDAEPLTLVDGIELAF